MPKITIRNVDEETRRNLQVLAARNGRSMEAEVRDILRYHTRRTPRIWPESAPPDPETPLAINHDEASANHDAPPETSHELPLLTDATEAIAGMNRLLEKMGLNELMLPENSRLE